MSDLSHKAEGFQKCRGEESLLHHFFIHTNICNFQSIYLSLEIQLREIKFSFSSTIKCIFLTQA